MKPIFPFSIFILIAAALSGSTVSRGAEEAPPPVPLDVLVGEIVAQNPELKFYAAEIDAAKAGRRVAGLWNDPELSVSAGRKRVTDTTGALAGEGTAWSVSVSQTFEWSGRLALRKSIANRQIELAELGLARFRAALQSHARTLAYGLFAAQEKAAAATEVAARYRALRELFVQRDPAGLTPLLETRVIEAQELALQRRATEATLAAQAALVELNQLRGSPFGTPVHTSGGRLVFNRSPDLDALLTAARENNFNFRMAKVELEQQGLQVSLARNERYPGVTVAPFLSQEKAGDRERVYGLGVTVPLPVTGRAGANTAIAEARRRQAETALLVAQRQIEREVIVAFQAFAVKLDEIGHWAPESAEKFREAADLADRHYRLGTVPLSTYVELQNSYLDAIDGLFATKLEALEAGQKIQLLTGLNFHAAEIAP